MSSVKVQTLMASLTVGQQEYPVTHVDYRATMNQWPSIQVEVLPGVSAGNGETDVRDVNAKLVKTLTAIKDNGDSCSIKFGAIDESGNAEVVSLTCFVRSVTLTIQMGDVKCTAILAPIYTKVDDLNLSLYKLDLVPDYDGLPLWPRVEEKDNIITYTHKCIDKLWENLEGKKLESLLKGKPEKEKKLITNAHKKNEKLITYFRQILNDSIEHVGDLYNIGKTISPYDFHLWNSIKNCLTTDTGSFLTTLCSYCNLFKLVYIPSTSDDDCGHLIPRHKLYQKVSGESPKDTPIIITSLYANIGSLGLAPLEYVSSICEQNHDYDGAHPLFEIVASYPELKESTAEGNWSCMKIAPPTWCIYNDKIIKTNGESADPSNKKGGKQEDASKTQDEFRKACLDVTTEWCKQEFCYQKSATSTANVASLFVTAPQIYGTLVKIKDNNNELMLSGFTTGYQQVLNKVGIGSGGTVETKFTLLGIETT